MAIDNTQIHELMDFYQQIYFTHDIPVPFGDHLKIYPVMVEDYYTFYTVVDILKLEKNDDPSGIGIPMTNLEYFIHQTKGEDEQSQIFTNKIIKLFELIFHIKNGIRCECDDGNNTFISYDDLYKILAVRQKEADQCHDEIEFLKLIYEIKKCPKCGKIREDIIRFNNLSNGKQDFVVDGQEISSDDFDLLRKIVLYQNIPDYNDEYINPDLKKELELAAKLENPNNVTPTLEKQELCIAASTAYTLKEVKEMSLRHMVMLLRTVDAKLHYFTYKQAESSGFVKFSNEIQHWVYSSDKPASLLDKAMSLSGLKSKMSPVTGGQ